MGDAQRETMLLTMKNDEFRRQPIAEERFICGNRRGA